MNQETKTNTQETLSDKPSRATRLPILLASISILAVSLLWLNEWQSNKNLERALTSKFASLNDKNQQSYAFAKNADTRSNEVAARAEILEEKYTESFDQQAALKALYQELANSREERMMADVEQLLVIASQQLQLAGNVKPALLALQAADTRLKAFDSPKIAQLRKSINQDMQRLQNLPSADITGISLKLANLTQQIDQLALISEHRPSQTAKNSATDRSANPWGKLAQEMWQDIKNMIQIEHVEHPEPALLSPEQAFFLRENIKLHLLTARIALFKHDDANFKADLAAAQNAISLHFDTKESLTTNTLNEIKTLANTSVSAELPDIDQSLRLINQYKLSLAQTNANKTKRQP